MEDSESYTRIRLLAMACHPTDSAGDVTVQWSAIDTVSSTQPLHVGLNGGQMIVGVVTTSEYCSHLFDGKSSS